MGSKHSKTLFDSMLTNPTKYSPLGKKLSLQCISEDSIVEYITKLGFVNDKDSSIQTLEKALKLNCTPEESKEDIESKTTAQNEQQLQSILAAGHEQQPEVKAIFQNVHMEDFPSQKLDSVRAYSSMMVKHFAASLVLLLGKVVSKKDAPSFCERVGQYLASLKDSHGGAGNSAALHLTVLMMDNQRLLTDPKVSKNLLDLFRGMQPLSLYGWSMQSLQIDHTLEIVKQALLSQLDANIDKLTAETKPTMCDYVQTLLYMGLVRGSIEEILLATKYLRNPQIVSSIDLSDVLKKLLELPEISQFFPIPSFSLTPDSIEFQVPFESINFKQTDWIGESTVSMSSVTDGKYVYFYSTVHGLLVLGVGKDKILGKIYAHNEEHDSKSEMSLLMLGNKVYCWADKKLQKLDPWKLEKADCEESASITDTEGILITSNGSSIVTYKKLENTSEDSSSDKIEANITFYHILTKEPKQEIKISHSITDLNQIIVLKNMLILKGTKKYEVIDLNNKTTIKQEDSDLLKNGTICVDTNTNELFAVYLKATSEGHHLAKLKAMNIKADISSAFEDRLKEAKNLLGMNKDEKTTYDKQKLLGLLGFHMSGTAEEKKEKIITSSEILLSALAARMLEARKVLDNVNMRDNEQMMKVFKMPVAVHLTARNLRTQIVLAETFFLEAKAAKTEESLNVALEKFNAAIYILNVHIAALTKCNFSLKECIGEKDAALFSKLCAEILVPIVKNNALSELPNVNKKLANYIQEACNECLSSSRIQSESLLVTIKAFNAAIKNFITTKKIDDELRSLFAWIAVPEKLEMVAAKVIEQDKDSIELLNSYLSLEQEYFRLKMLELTTGESKDFPEFKTALNEIYGSFCSLFEKIFVMIADKIANRKGEAQDFIINVIPTAFQTHLTNVLAELKQSYVTFKANLMKKSEELLKDGKFGIEYSVFWKAVEEELGMNMLIVHLMTLLITAIFGMSYPPEQMFRLAEILLKSTDEIKAIFVEIESEKEKNTETNEPKFPLHGIKEYFESVHPLPSEEVTEEKTISFEGATKLHIMTVEEIDIPGPQNSTITIRPKNKSVTPIVLDCKKPNCNQIIKGHEVEIAVKIEATNVTKKHSYKGYKIEVRPKYIYGQRIIKDLLRGIMWTVCFVAKSALQVFEERGSNSANSELIKNILGSSLLSGGLPTSVFKEVFSQQFNKRFTIMKDELGLDDSYEFVDTETIYTDILKGGNEEVEKVLKIVIAEHGKKQPFAKVTDPLTEKIARAVFALLLKTTNSLSKWKALAETSDKTALGKIITLWGTAARMKIWFAEQKRILAEKHADEDWDKLLQGVVKTVQDKANLLLMFRSPIIAEKENIAQLKTVTLLRAESEDAHAKMPETEMIKSRMEKWKNIQKLPPSDESKEMSLSSSVVKILQSDITCAQLATQFENYYLRGMAIYATMNICNRACSYLSSKKIRADTFAWITSIFKSGSIVNWHYSQRTTACGAQFQFMLRSAFFNIIKQVLEYVATARNNKEIACLMDALKWNYTATDHVFIRDCRLFSCLRSENMKNFISTLWGKPLKAEEDTPSILLDTFEYIVIKILTRALSAQNASEKKEEDVTDMIPRLEKSISSLDEGSAARLMDSILKIIFDEISKAAMSYENGNGIKPEVLDGYMQIQKMEKKKIQEEKTLDLDKQRRDFESTSKNTYSQEFCTRLLQLLYRVCVAVQDDANMKSRINLLIEDTYILSLLNLLFLGSMQQQFIVLQTFPLLLNISSDNIEAGCKNVLETLKKRGVSTERYTASYALDLLIIYAMKNCQNVWLTKDKDTTDCNYTLSKCATSVVRDIINKNKEMLLIISNIVKIVLFGTNDEINNLPKGCKNRLFIDVLISIVGGDCECLFKGARGIAKERNKYTIVSFVSQKQEGGQTVKHYEWNYLPKKHTDLMVHLIEEEMGNGEASVEIMPITEFMLATSEVNLADVLLGKSKEEIIESIKKIIIGTPASENPLIDTISVKLMKLMQILLKQNPDLCKQLFTKDVLDSLVANSLKNPKTTQHKSTLITELIVEELKKNASMAEISPIICVNTSVPMVKLNPEMLIFTYMTSNICVPVLARTSSTSNIDGKGWLYTTYKPVMQATEINQKVLLVEDLETVNIENVNAAKPVAIISSSDLSKAAEKKPALKTMPIFEINQANMVQLAASMSSAMDESAKMHKMKVNVLVSEYLNKKTDAEMNSNNIREIIRSIIDDKPKAEEKKEEEVVKAEGEDLLKIFTNSFDSKYIFSKKNDKSITEEKETLKKNFSSGFQNLFNQASSPSISSYKSALADLRIFYSRNILSLLLLENSAEISKFAELKSQMFPILVLLSIEADYIKLGFGSKVLSDKLNKLLTLIAQIPNIADQLIDWLKSRLEKAGKPKKAEASFKLLSTSEEELMKTIYMRFVYRFVRIIMKNNISMIIRNERIGEILNCLLLLAASNSLGADQYRAIKLMKNIMGSVLTIKQDLPPAICSNILTCKAISSLSTYYQRREKEKSTTIWRNGMEILQKASSLYRYCVTIHGELVQTSCLKDDSVLYVQLMLMRSFPDFKKFLTYMWIRMHKEALKSKMEMTFDISKKIYDTQYLAIIHDPLAQQFVLSPKIQSSLPILLSLDKLGKTKLSLLNEETKDHKQSFNRIYIHYPYAGSTVFAFGSNEGGRIGIKDVKATHTPTTVSGLGMHPITHILSAGSHTIICNKSNRYIVTGRGDGRLHTDRDTFQEYNNDKVSNIIATNQGATLYFNPRHNNWMATGRNPDQMFTISSNPISGECSFKPSKEGDPSQVSISQFHSLILYKDNRLFACPIAKKELFGTWVEGSSSDFSLVKMPDQVKTINKILAINTATILLCTNKNTSKKEILSYGVPGDAGLGQGTAKNTEQYHRLDYPEDIEFEDIFGCETMAGAITSTGDLYTWGKGTKGILGLFKEDGSPIEEANKPTKVMSLEKYKTVKVSVSNTHMLVVTEDKDTSKALRLFGFGDNSKGQLGDKEPNVNKTEITFFKDKEPKLICAGSACSFVLCGTRTKGIVHSEAICENHKQPIREILYTTKTKEGKLMSWCKDCLKSVPKLVLATRYPIKKIAEKPIPVFESIEITEGEAEKVACKMCTQEILGAIYRSAIKEEASILCETCYMKTPNKMIPMIYYRFENTKIKGKNLPEFAFTDFYEVLTSTVSMNYRPVYQLELPEHLMDKSLKPTYEEYLAESKDFEREHDMDLLTILNDHLVDKSKTIDSISLKTDLPVSYDKKSTLAKFKPEQLARRMKMLVKMNKMMEKAIKYIDFTSKAESEEDLYLHYVKIKDYITAKTKDNISEKAIQNLPSTSGRPDVTLVRHKAFLLKASGQVDHSGQRSLFGQLMKSLKTRLNEFQKKPREEQFPYRVVFKGEGGTDAGGLFRESIDHICDELQSTCLPLFLPTPNNKTAFGEYREKWTINPGSKQSTHIEMYEFFGAMLGMSFRLGHVLALNLSSLFWKQLLGDPVDRSDLKAIDTYCVQCLEDIATIEKKGGNESNFESIIDANFATRLSDGTEVELKKSGKDSKVTFATRNEYVQLVEKSRLEEGSLQMKAIKAGMAKIVPPSIIKLYSWRDIEIKICGKPTFNVDALKKITRYSSCAETDPHVQVFWQALSEFTDEERSLYLRFVWGRSRMPAYTEHHTHTIAKKRASRPDEVFPETHTCSFQIDLPEYSTVDVAKGRLRYAIRFCQSIDGDRDTLEAWED